MPISATDPERYAEQSSLKGLATTEVPLMMAAAELDPHGFVLQFDLAKQASCKRASGCARTLLLRSTATCRKYIRSTLPTPD